VATAVTCCGLLAGIPAAYAIARYKFAGRNAIYTFFTAPLLLPSIVLGVGMLLIFVRLRLTATYPGLILGHLVIAFPFVLRILITSIANLPPDLVVRRFGKHGASLIDRARGMDPDPVHQGDPAKSVGHEHTFDVDTSDPEMIERTLLAMAEGVSGRLRSAGVRASTIAVKIRDSSFRTITRQRTLKEPTDLTEPIYRTALELARPEVRGLRVRLLGVSASNLGEREQLGLFALEDPRRRAAIEAADALRRRYGSDAVTRGRLVGAGLPAPFERDPRNPSDRRARGVPTDADEVVDPAAAGDLERDTLADTDLDDSPVDDA